jgi:hypothetical protein
VNNSPYLRTRALVLAKELLQGLADAESSWDAPASIRAQAQTILEHYPMLADIQLVHEALPDLFGPVPPFSRMRGNPQTDSLLDASAQAVKRTKRGGDS